MREFSDRLCEAILRTKTPAMVGVDPQWELLPEEVRQAALEEHGETFAAVASAYRLFCSAVLEQVAGLVPVVKFQAAFFEAIGPLGLSTLGSLLQMARSCGLLVILDGKRNDIGSTANGYAQGYLGSMRIGSSLRRAWAADALTVNPYLGEEGLTPFLEVARANGAGVFVLVRTSNPGAGQWQDMPGPDGRLLHERIADRVETWSSESIGQYGFGAVGAVVGATVPQQLTSLRQRMPKSILLIPGYGAQGGTAGDIASAFDSRGLGAVVNNSRGILYAYQSKVYGSPDWRASIASATRGMIADLAEQTPAGALRA